MVSGAAPECTNRTGKTSNNSFHCLPPRSKPELRKNWCLKLKRQIISDVLLVCSDHFEAEYFKWDVKVWIFSLNQTYKNRGRMTYSLSYLSVSIYTYLFYICYASQDTVARKLLAAWPQSWDRSWSVFTADF